MDIRVDNLDFYKLKIIDQSGQFIDFDLRSELAINEDNLLTEMREQPSKYIYWSSLLEQIRLYKEGADLEMEALLGELDTEARASLNGSGIKPTKDSVDAYIKRTEAYKTTKEKCNYYEFLVRRLHFIVKSFEQRKDLMQSYGRQIEQDKNYGRGAGRYLEQPSNYHTP